MGVGGAYMRAGRWCVAGVCALMTGLIAPAAALAAAGSLHVRIAGLPAGDSGQVTVRPPNGSVAVLHASTVLGRLRPGLYEVSVRPVQLGPSRDLPWGGMAYPVSGALQVHVRAGHLSGVTAAYGSIESAAARMLRGRPLAVGGPADSPSWIKLRRGEQPAVGTVLVSRPNQTLPAGLFHVVTGIRRFRRVVWATLRPARVAEAYPTLYIDRSLPTEPLLSRTSTPTCPGLDVRLHPRLVADKFRAGAAGLSGALLIRLTGSVVLNLSADGASSCHPGSTTSPIWRGFAQVGGTVPVPYFIQPGLALHWRASATFAFAATTFLKLTAGARFTGFRARPVFAGRPRPSGSLAHDGDVTIAAAVRTHLGLGLPGEALASIRVTPAVTGQSGPCSFGAQTTDQVRSGRRGRPITMQTTAPPSVTRCPRHTLTVGGTGNGSGAVTSMPNGIDCGGQCSTVLDSGSHVTLTATPRPGSRFDGWSGGGCSGTATCTVQVASDTTVMAKFSQPVLTVALSGTGSGTVAATGGLNCPGACSRSYPIGSSVSLVATPAQDSVFTGWSGGGCSGTGHCTVPMTSDSTVTATFAPDVSGAARRKLISLLQDVPAATGASYETRDNTGLTVDTIKIIASPAGGYLGVYHVNSNGQFQVRLGASPDLTHWTYLTTLDDNGSQPTIARLSDGSFVVADEHSTPDGSSHVRLAGYSDLASLEAGTPSRTFDAPLTLSASHEGTPNIRSATINGSLGDSQLEVGFHYSDGSVNGDREAIGTLSNFTTWSAQPNQDLNHPFDSTPANIGDRDFIQFEGYPFTVVEGQSVAGDWGSWRLYLYDETAKTATPIQVQTAGGSQSFGNPAVTILTDPAGHQALLASYFIFSSNVAPGEAGPLIFWTEY